MNSEESKVIVMPLGAEENLDLASDHGFDVWRQSMMKAIRDNFENDGYLSPVAFFVAHADPRTGKPLPCATPIIVPIIDLSTNERKDAVASRLRQLGRLMQATAVMFAAEAWQRTPLGQTMGEILVCSVERAGQDAPKCYLSYVQRPANSKATTSEWDGDGMVGSDGSRFGRLLDRDEDEAGR
jgi:hypothetical protein